MSFTVPDYCLSYVSSTGAWQGMTWTRDAALVLLGAAGCALALQVCPCLAGMQLQDVCLLCRQAERDIDSVLLPLHQPACLLLAYQGIGQSQPCTAAAVRKAQFKPFQLCSSG